MISEERSIEDRFHTLTSLLIEKSLTISAMESCSGGLIGVLLSDQEGASAVVPGGFFTYSNEQKIACGIPAEVIREYGVYSTETARAMARTCRDRMHTDIGIGVTGSIGTIDPNNADSVPGEVYIAVDFCGTIHERRLTLEPADRRISRYRIADSVAHMVKDLLKG